MTLFSRRRLLVGTGAGLLALVGLAGFAFRNGLASAVDHVIRVEFNDRIADDPAAAEFLEDFVAFMVENEGMMSQAKAAVMRWGPTALLDLTERDEAFRSWVLESFVYSTTAVRSFETGDALVFVSPSYRGDAVCANTLSHSWL